MKLYPYQKKIVQYAIDNLKKENNIFVAEAPTGSGKSVIIADIAQKMVQGGKKVIVSTSSNQLALELHNRYKEFYDYGKYNIVIGNENYVDFTKLPLLYDYFKTERKERIAEYVKNVSNLQNSNYNLISDIFIDNLINFLEIDTDEESKEYLVKLISSNGKKEYVNGFFQNDISFTNHYYLLYQFLYGKRDFSDFIVILDEAHLLNEAADTIFSSQFSFFRFYTGAKGLYTVLNKSNERGAKTLKADVVKIAKQAEYLFEKYASANKAGDYFVGGETVNEMLLQLRKRFFEKKNIKETLEKLENKKFKDDVVNQYMALVSREAKEAKELVLTNANDVGVHYSSQRGYPKLIATDKDYFLKLIGFWSKFDRGVALSATMSIAGDEKFVVSRIGLRNSEKKYFFYKLDPVFSKEQMRVHIIDESFPKPEVNDEGAVNSKWAQAVAEYVISTYEKKNSMVLVGGFAEVEAIQSYLEKMADVPIVTAQRGKSVQSVVERFKKIGGILIATRNYGTGIDLHGKLLEKLYIAKLPYPVIGNKKYIDMKYRSMMEGNNLFYFVLENEMLLNLKQFKGRLIRTKEDRGDLYLLDSRVYNNKARYRAVKAILDEI